MEDNRDKKIEDYLHLYLGAKYRWKDEDGEWRRALVLTTYQLNWIKTMGGVYIQLILRPLSDMSEEDLKDVFKRVSLFNLSDCELLFGKEENEVWCNAEKSGRVIDSISYDYNVFEIMNNDGSFHPLNPQSEAIKILLSKHFDLFNLIESGLAIDATTLKI